MPVSLGPDPALPEYQTSVSCASSPRELTPNFWQALLRCYSTVRGLRNSAAATSRFDLP